MTNYCVDCGCPITGNRYARCRQCNGERRRAIQENRRRFRHRARQTTQREKATLARWQVVRLCEMAEEGVR